MKISRISLLLILFMFACLSSCSSDEAITESSIERKQIAEYSEKYSPIGELHNMVFYFITKAINGILKK